MVSRFVVVPVNPPGGLVGTYRSGRLRLVALLPGLALLKEVLVELLQHERLSILRPMLCSTMRLASMTPSIRITR
jgi:hypothetical protein